VDRRCATAYGVDHDGRSWVGVELMMDFLLFTAGLCVVFAGIAVTIVWGR
jgi:hypothetical protein